MSDEIRKLAATTYNQAFDAVEAGDNPVWALELAATSLNLWRQVGNDQNLAIGNWLYSRALVAASAPQAAVQAAKHSLAHTGAIDSPADWLVASGLEGYARALLAAGEQEANQVLESALAAIDAISDTEARQMIASQIADLKPNS